MDDREMFEAWASSEGINTCHSIHNDDVYAYPSARVAWRGWQAARRTTPDREAIVRAGEDVVITNVPNRIYLNLGDIYEMGELPFQQLTDVTWCEDRIDDTDIEYVRAAAPTSDKGGA